MSIKINWHCLKVVIYVAICRVDFWLAFQSLALTSIVCMYVSSYIMIFMSLVSLFNTFPKLAIASVVTLLVSWQDCSCILAEEGAKPILPLATRVTASRSWTFFGNSALGPFSLPYQRSSTFFLVSTLSTTLSAATPRSQQYPEHTLHLLQGHTNQTLAC